MIKCRLLLLADRLEKVEAMPKPKRPRAFNLSRWVSKERCGTVACAVGEATFMKRFRELGLRYNYRKGEPTFKGLDNWEAVSKFFGIMNNDAFRLFTSQAYRDEVDPDDSYDGPISEIVTPGIVAARIRAFVKRG